MVQADEEQAKAKNRRQATDRWCLSFSYLCFWSVRLLRCLRSEMDYGGARAVSNSRHHRDPFPLPPVEAFIGSHSFSKSQARRVASARSTLNRLAASTPGRSGLPGNPTCNTSTRSTPTFSQASIMVNVAPCVGRYGPCPDDLEEGSLSELLSSKDL